MTLTEEIKNKIVEEYESFKEHMYAGKSLEQRKALDQFFTPPSLTIQMIEKFDCDTLAGKNILDPTSGSGNLLVACLIAGADPDKLYGNDYDNDMVILCRKRLKDVCNRMNKIGFKDYQIHRGNALQKFCLNYFEEDYDQIYNFNKIDDLSYDPDDGVKEELW